MFYIYYINAKERDNVIFSEATPVKIDAPKPKDTTDRGRGRGRGNSRHGRDKGNIIQVYPIYTKCLLTICINHNIVLHTLIYLYFSLLVYGRKEYLQHLLLAEDPIVVPTVAIVQVLKNIWKNLN